jgi:hypothetical protein
MSHPFVGGLGLCRCTGGEASSSSRLGLSSPWGVIEFFLADENIASMHAEGELEME